MSETHQGFNNELSAPPANVAHLFSIEEWDQFDDTTKGALSLIGVGSSGLPDLSTNHDDYLVEIYAEVKVN